MHDKHLEEQEVSSELVYEGGLLRVKRDLVKLPNERLSTREYIEHPGAVAVVPVLPSGEILLLRQFRYPLRRTFIEVPAGKIDPGEEPLECGRRELLEEAGYEAGEMALLCTIHPCIGYADEHIAIYLACDLAYRGRQQDEDEFVDCFSLPLDAALEAIRDGRITDAKTVAALFWAEKAIRQGWSGFGNGNP
jgi:ADP-ribose pyrophosphatase